MRALKLSVFVLFVMGLGLSMAIMPTAVHSQTGFSEAPAGFDNQTNDFEPQGTDPNVLGTFVGDKAAFEDRDTIETGLGPVYNAQACAECHQNPVTGGIAQLDELRAGHSGPNGEFVEAPGGSLIQARATNAQIQERVPIGPRIAFMSNGQITVMGFDGGQYGPVGNTPVAGYYPTFSPDGKQIAFEKNVGGNLYNIFVMNNDGTNLHQITTTQSQDVSPAWSPDGAKIAFASRRTGSWQIFLMNPDGTGQTNISNNSTFGDIQPAWSRDSRFIAFSRGPADPFQPGALTHIWRMNADGSAQVQLTNALNNDERPTWSPDGTMIAFQRRLAAGSQIFKMDSLGAVQTQLTTVGSNGNPSWSPDGSMIAFDSNRDGSTTHIWAMATDGTNQTRLSNFASTELLPAYSLDQGEDVRTFRTSLNTLGDGFVEAVADSTLLSIRDSQPSGMRGTAIFVPVLETPGCNPAVPATCDQRVGRFGWKNSIASLLTFSAAAYRAEVGITSPLQATELTSLGRSVTAFDPVPDPEDDGGPLGLGEDVEASRASCARPKRRRAIPISSTSSRRPSRGGASSSQVCRP